MRARACIVLLLAAGLFSCARNISSLVLRARLHNAQVLQIGNSVRIADKHVGEVISVRPLGLEVSEVVFRIDDRAAGDRIPSDATVSIERARPGEYFLSLEVGGKSGPVVKTDQWLKEAGQPPGPAPGKSEETSLQQP